MRTQIEVNVQNRTKALKAAIRNYNTHADKAGKPKLDTATATHDVSLPLALLPAVDFSHASAAQVYQLAHNGDLQLFGPWSSAESWASVQGRRVTQAVFDRRRVQEERQRLAVELELVSLPSLMPISLAVPLIALQTCRNLVPRRGNFLDAVAT